jgi:hypothetical protein
VYKTIFNKIILSISESISGIHLTQYLDELNKLTSLDVHELSVLQKEKLRKLLYHVSNFRHITKVLKLI